MSNIPEHDTFEGTIARTIGASEPWWPETVLPTVGSPNVVVVLLDDTGFSHFGCYGGPIDTPNLDRLAERGLRYANFHTTALCSPTRAALLTGRNHHSVGMQALSNFDTGFPNMRGRIAPSAGTLAEVLGDAGYSTFCLGKWHLAPMREASAAGPYENWPLGKGFDRFYGFMQGETDQFHPELYADNHLIDPPCGPEDGYHLSEDLVDQAITMIRNQHSLVPERPWFCYLAFGATHAPHQAPDDYLAKYRGRFDEGWDVWRQRVFERQLDLGIIPEGTDLSPRNPGVEAWDDLSDDEQRFAARLQEAFAAFLDHTDAQIGRLLDQLEALGLADDTIVMVASDNGASQEGRASGVMDEFRYFNDLEEDLPSAYERLDDIGTRRSFSNYPWGWAQVGNCPGKRYKQNTHGGGVRDPLIVSWPNGIPAESNGGVRHQFHHVIDLAPTLLDAIGVTAPDTIRGVAQQPIQGVSMRYSFDEDAADTNKKPTPKTSQYFEMRGHLAIWAGGWKAVTFHAPEGSLDDDTWELYHLDQDFSECHDLAGEQPEKLAELQAIFWADAERYGVLPIDERGRFGGAFAGRPVPGTPRARDSFSYRPPLDRIPSDSAPALGSRSWNLQASVHRTSADAGGALFAYGTVNNGLTAYLDRGHLVYEHNFFQHRTFVRSSESVPVGDCLLGISLDRVRGGPARVRLSIDGIQVGEGIVPELAMMISSVGLDIGRATAGVSDAVAAPGDFEGDIASLRIDTTRAYSDGDELAAEIRTALGSQ